jgi:hypothetical protein
MKSNAKRGKAEPKNIKKVEAKGGKADGAMKKKEMAAKTKKR